MCRFLSAISNGKGKVLFFTLEDIQKIEKENNPQDYDWNSHTSIADYHGIKGKKEDLWNKWQYNPETKELKVDGVLNAKDDTKKVRAAIIRYLKEKGEIYCLKIYNRNSGDCNSGSVNSGDRNSGNWNSGDRNSGNWNSGTRNSGDGNSGNVNSGDGNSGNRNSGNWNSGNWNSGNWNSGFCNTNESKIRLFNKETDIMRDKFEFPNFFYFNLTDWIEVSNMTKIEKIQYPDYKVTDGFLRVFTYKEGWQNSFNNATKKDIDTLLKLPNFDYNIFEDLSGITKKMIEYKLRK